MILFTQTTPVKSVQGKQFCVVQDAGTDTVPNTTNPGHVDGLSICEITLLVHPLQAQMKGTHKTLSSTAQNRSVFFHN